MNMIVNRRLHMGRRRPALAGPVHHSMHQAQRLRQQ